MSRTPDGLTTRDRTVAIRGTDAWVGLVDRLRGNLSRSAYFRSLVEKDRVEQERERRRDS